jgi:hypothetical protein
MRTLFTQQKGVKVARSRPTLADKFARSVKPSWGWAEHTTFDWTVTIAGARSSPRPSVRQLAI